MSPWICSIGLGLDFSAAWIFLCELLCQLCILTCVTALLYLKHVFFFCELGTGTVDVRGIVIWKREVKIFFVGKTWKTDWTVSSVEFDVVRAWGSTVSVSVCWTTNGLLQDLGKGLNWRDVSEALPDNLTVSSERRCTQSVNGNARHNSDEQQAEENSESWEK